jgi:hypothetical protein
MIDATKALKDVAFYIHLLYGDCSFRFKRLPVSSTDLKLILDGQQDKVKKAKLLKLGKIIFLLDTLDMAKRQSIYDSIFSTLENIIKSEKDCIFYKNSEITIATANYKLDLIQKTYAELGKLIEKHIFPMNTLILKTNLLIKNCDYSKTVPMLNLIS